MRAKAITVDTQVSDHKIKIWGVLLRPLSIDGGMITLYDEADSSKTATKKVCALMAPAGSTGSVSESKSVMFPSPLLCSTGLYADIEGSNAVVIIYLE